MSIPNCIRILAGLLALLLAAPVAAQDGARGFQWDARKGGARVLLMGTIHVGRDGQTTLGAAQRALVAQAAVIALEADVFNAQRALAAMQKYALYGSGPGLDARIDAAQRARIERVAQRVGLPLEAAWRMKPWMLANSLIVLEAQRQGYSVAQSTEAQLYALTQETGKPLAEIESLDLQFELFERASLAVQMAYLDQSLLSLEDASAARELGGLVQAWVRSDTAFLEAQLLKLRQSTSAAERFVAQKIVDERHPAMVAAVERLAASGRLHLVAVGSLHYFGPNGLLALLRNRGWTITAVP